MCWLWPWRKAANVHQPVPDPDPLFHRFPATGLHNRESNPKAMTCRCGRPRVMRWRRSNESGGLLPWLYCPRCDEIPPIRPTPKDPTTEGERP